ncbi:MAG: glycosyltransferase family 39 protein [Pseudomonadota bacterium]
MTKFFINAWDKFHAAPFRHQLVMIAGLAFVLRMVWALIAPIEPVSDPYIYMVTAQNLAQHGVYGVTPEEPFSYWPVGAAAIYALGYKVLGVNMAPVLLLNFTAGLLLVFTTGLLARRWYGQTAGLITAFLIAIWPNLIMYTTLFASEIFFLVLVNLMLLAWRPEDARPWGLAILAGLFLAGAIFVRPVALLLPVVMVGLAFLRQSAPLGRSLTFTLAAVIVAGVAIAPWTARNMALHNEFVLISTNGGPNLWMGNNPDSDGGYMPLPDYVDGMSETERAKILGDQAKAYMLEDPLRTFNNIIYRAVKSHDRETIAIAWNTEGLLKRYDIEERALLPLKLMSQAFWMSVLAFGLGGAVLTVASMRNEKTWLARLGALASPALVLWAYYTSVHAVIVAGDRYHIPSIPFIAMIAALAVIAAWRKFAAPRIGSRDSAVRGASS